MSARQQWALVLIRRHPNPPSYGSPDWLALPETHPAKIAAVVVAAECWAQNGDNLTERLNGEVLALSHAHKQAEDAEWVAQKTLGPLAPRATPKELETGYWEWVRGDVA